MEDNQDAEPERSVTVTKIPDVNNFRGRRTYFGSWIQRSQSMMVERAEQLTSWCQEAKRENACTVFLLFPCYSTMATSLWDGTSRLQGPVWKWPYGHTQKYVLLISSIQSSWHGSLGITAPMP
jgi:hypothetical protein